MQPHRRRGLTIVELLVVIAVIGMLVGLLLPAVQSARESSRRTACGNNIRQVGLACLNYHEAMRALPPVTSGAPSYNSWMLLVLPYMEQGSTAAVLRNTSSGTAAKQAAAAAPIPAFICPSCQVALMGSNYAGGADGNRYSKCNYLGNGGPQGWYSQSCPGGWNQVPARIALSRGAIRLDKGLPLDAVFDGTSLTFLAGESGGRTSAEADVVGTFAPRGDSFIPANVVRFGAYKINGMYNNANDPWGPTRGFNSNHPGGAMFVMCDGSVRFVSDTISFYAGNLIWATNYCLAGTDPKYPDNCLALMRQPYYGVFQYLSCRDDRNMIKGNF